jgi:S1-C subfamily serine protease
MKRVTLYSSSHRTRVAASPPAAAPVSDTPAPGATPPPAGPAPAGRRRYLEQALPVAAGGLVALAAVAAYLLLAPPTARPITQQDIDAAVLNTLETKPLPSPAAKAYEIVRPSIVRVQGMASVEPTSDDVEKAVGSGVVIVDKGTILTNLHVVAGADRIRVTFHDGMESEATIVGLKPEHDLAVLQAKSVPDDLPAATLRSTGDLLVGDRVVAVGFPFGIGPSASAGVVSGLRREFQSPEGKRLLTNLIQFDAAANPGSSGGPLVTADGEVVGIVTAILNPSEQRVFIGIGFAVPIENAASAVGMHPF